MVILDAITPVGAEHAGHAVIPTVLAGPAPADPLLFVGATETIVLPLLSITFQPFSPPQVPVFR